MATLSVLRGNGSVLWEHGYDAPIGSTPAIGDIDADGVPEVIVGLGGDAGNLHHPGGVVAVGADGNQKWRYNLPDNFPADGHPDAVYSSPAICETDGDPYREIAVGGWDHHIHLIDHAGNPIWFDPWVGHMGIWNMDTVWSSAACVDLNGDGRDEVIIGADSSCCGILPDGTPSTDGGFVYVIDGTGNVLVRRHVPEVIFSTPAVADLNGDGILEIVVGTGSYFYYQNGQTQQPYVYVFRTQNVYSNLHRADPNKLPFSPGWPVAVPYPGRGTPALGDLDGDGDIEIVISRNRNGNAGPCDGAGNGSGCHTMLHAFHHTGAPVNGFPIWPSIGGSSASVEGSPTIANVDTDPAPEILFPLLWDVLVIGTNGQVEGTFHTQWTTGHTAAAGDTDGDGLLDVRVGGSHNQNPYHGYLWRFSTASTQHRLEWPSFRRLEANRGFYPWHNSVLPRRAFLPSVYR